MMQKFLEAVAAQQAWYKKAGTSDQITVMRIIDRNPDTKVSTYSETQAITTHTHGPASPPPHDAGYDAFAALYMHGEVAFRRRPHRMPHSAVHRMSGHR
jgi:hypothetical protein